MNGQENNSRIKSGLRRIGRMIKKWITELGRTVRDLEFRKTVTYIFRKKYAWVIFALLFLAFSLTGYLMGGESFFTALYASIILFFFNPISPVNNALVMIGKFGSLAVSSSLIFKTFSRVFRLIRHRRLSREKDSTAVYTDNEWGRQLVGRLKHGYLSRGRGYGELMDARFHIFMYSDDAANLSLYDRYREDLKENGARAYIMLNHTDAFLLDKDIDSDSPHYFNLYDLMAREYWKNHHLYDAVGRAVSCGGGKAVRVAIVGYGEAGRAVCRYAVLNNIYRPNQVIEYHVWGCAPWQAEFLKGLDLMNGDRIVIHTENCLNAGELELLRGMDRVIITRDEHMELLQQLLRGVTDAEIHCCCEGETDLGTLFEYPDEKLVTFGRMDNILTEENIKQELLLKQAKLLNYDYTLRSGGYGQDKELPGRGGEKTEDGKELWEKEMDAEWRGLNGFTKGSNIAQADHLWIKKRLRADLPGSAEEKENVIGRLEHIRWCRFHFVNHWTFAPELVNAARKKDAPRKRHGLLTADIPEDELPKDRIYSKKISDMIEESLKD